MGFLGLSSGVGRVPQRVARETPLLLFIWSTFAGRLRLWILVVLVVEELELDGLLGRRILGRPRSGTVIFKGGLVAIDLVLLLLAQVFIILNLFGKFNQVVWLLLRRVLRHLRYDNNFNKSESVRDKQIKSQEEFTINYSLDRGWQDRLIRTLFFRTSLFLRLNQRIV